MSLLGTKLDVLIAASVALAMVAGGGRLLQAQGQTQSGAPGAAAGASVTRSVVFVDAAHGGPDVGGQLGNQVLEKDVTLALAGRLKATLAAAGFSVVASREEDPPDSITNDQRAEAANRVRAVACVVLHATRTGSGVHLYASTLGPKDTMATSDLEGRPVFVPVLWAEAQQDFVEQSVRLKELVASGLRGSGVAVLSTRAAVRPLDSMQCPAIAVEVAPLGGTAVGDAGYQQRVVEALARSLVQWRGEVDAAMAAARAAAADAAKAAAEAGGASSGTGVTPPPTPKGTP